MSVNQHKNRLLWIIFTLLFLSLSAQAEKRVALVIGNSDYKQGFLNNPVNDADDISEALKRLNFEVTLLKDASRKSMLKAVQNFRSDLDSSTDVALFYYAGHGAQFEGDSYLLPLKAEIASTADLPIEALKTKDMLTQMRSSGSRVNVMVLDACRDLPFPQLKRGRTRGLARIDASNSALVAYSTSPGSTAADGRGRNSPYTAALLKLLPQTNLTITQLFNDVGVAVDQGTGGKQTPWVNSSPMPRIYLAEQKTPQSEKQQARVQAVASPQVKQAIPILRQALKPEMVFIQGGTFQMDCVSGNNCQSNENTHTVTTNDFWIGKYEVTFDEWQACVDDGGCQSNKKPDDEGWGRGKRPVINVNWYDVYKYTDWLSKKTSENYRLPTDAEWAYAAPAGSKGKYDESELCAYGNHADKSMKNSWGNQKCSDGIGSKTAKIGSYQANIRGLYDTIGNVGEWTCSQFDYSSDLESQCINNKSSNHSVSVRGGSWYNFPALIKSDKYGLTADVRADDVGFRLVKISD